MFKINAKELLEAQAALLVAIALQLTSRRVGGDLLPGSHYLLIAFEFVLIVVISFARLFRTKHARVMDHAVAIVLLGLISTANISDLIFVLHALIFSHSSINGEQLLASSIVIFLTNIVVFGLWYWEIDSPGLTGAKWSKFDKAFQFTQQDLSSEFPDWRPQFADYLFISITNAISFAPAETRPLTRQAKALMAAQSLVSVLTLALVIARSVNILGMG